MSVLIELMEERALGAKSLANQLGLADVSIIYKWLKRLTYANSC